jgi:Wzt C-terminal domain
VANSASGGERSGRFEAGEEVEFEVSFENALAPGRYAVSTLLSQPDGEIVDRFEGIFTFVVSGARAGGGLVDLTHDIALTRSGSRSMAPETR